VPFAWYAFELVQPAVVESDSGAGHQVFHRAGHQHLAGLRLSSDTSADVDGDSTEFAVYELAFTGVKAGADLEPQVGNGAADRAGAANASSWSIEYASAVPSS
jgi:hypothetical protein